MTHTGLSPSMVCVVRALLLTTTFVTPLSVRDRTGDSHYTVSATPTGFNAETVWAHSFSLAATGEVEVSFLSWRY